MRKLFKQFVKFLTDDYKKERYDFIRKMFEMPSRWNQYKTDKGYIKGLTHYDIFQEINAKLTKTSYAEVVSIVEELKVRQIIHKAGVDKDSGGGSIYTPLVWY